MARQITSGTRLEHLVRAHLVANDDDGVRQLALELRPARQRGYLTPRELESICHWKSPRAIRQIRRNSKDAVRTVTRRALRSCNDRERVSTLIELYGVSVPMASAVLTLLFPRRYAVIDLRVWQLLYRLGSVTGNARGVGLKVDHWLEFLAVVRRVSAALRVTPRRAERTLFGIHRARQRGTLYGKGLT
jgi:hypothetical protein